MYYIKKISLTGPGLETSEVEFTPGMNLIYGPSQTGKSYVTKCIKFMYGAKEAKIDTSYGFDTVHMTLDVDGKPLYLTRGLKEEQIHVSGNIDGIDNGDYSLSSGKLQIGDLWLRLMGITPGEKIIAKNDYTTQRFYFSSIWHMFLLDEHKIDKEESVMMPSQYPKWPKTKAAILYLMTGRNYLEDYKPTENKKSKESRKALETFIGGRISYLIKKKRDLDDRYNGKSVADLEKMISEILAEIDSAEKEMNRALNRSHELAADIVKIDDQLVDDQALSNRYKALRSQYRSDIRRLTFIAEGDIQEAKIHKPNACPFCGSEIKKKQFQSYVEPAKAEVEKLIPKISDLQDAQDDLATEIKTLNKRKVSDTTEKEQIDQRIKAEMTPKIEILRDRLVEYTQAVQYAKEKEVLSEMEDNMKEELKKQDEGDETAQKFDVEAHFTSDILEKWEGLMNDLLRECRYDKFDTADFSLNSFDVSINGHPKDTFGEGYCAFVNVVMILALQKYLQECGTYHPGVLVFDSPILSLKERISIKASEGMQASLFRYMVNHQDKYQTIVIENEPPHIDYSSINTIHFTQEDDGQSRYGLLKGVK